jgi:hypothetical protein
MKKIMKKIVTLVCLMAVMFVPCQTVLAESNDNSMPRMSFISNYCLSLDINGTTADVEADVTGHVLDATRAKVIAELQVKNGNSWIPVAIWTDDQYNYKAFVEETHDVVKGHTYRVKGTFMVWEGSAYETEYSFSPEITA